MQMYQYLVQRKYKGVAKTCGFLVLLGVFSWLVFFLPKPHQPQFSVDLSWQNVNETKQPLFESYAIPQPKFLLAAHSSTFDILPNGDLLAFWFAGSHEGKPDVKIWQSKFSNGRWSMAQAVVSPASLAYATHQFIKKVGNPVIYRAANGQWHLFVVSVGIGGWSGSSLNHLISNDNAQTWQPAKKLILSPFFNLSTLDRTRPILLMDGGFYVPVYHEFMRTYPELIRFDKNGNFIEQIRMSGKNYMLQPSIVVYTESTAQGFLRNSNKEDKILYMQTTDNGGTRWSEPFPTNLTNQDSSLVVVRIAPDTVLMVHNIGQRSRLALAISHNGIIWQTVAFLESTPQMEFSYPSIQVHDGLIDILYTWNRKYIRHVRFNFAWLKSQEHKMGIRVNDN